MTGPGRPDPQALLEDARRQGRGRLKIHLGMAPGVGKTYAMLEAARRLHAEGVDLLIGLVETHGRAETEALLDGLPVLPRLSIDYRGHVLTEFDLDAALARRPAHLVLDELAHSNAPGCRHPKRWQDVEELLKAGIDVDTALNIQHVEGLSDIVARITGVRVQETVPDAVIDTADAIELIDLTPADLVRRLEQGKVYAAGLAGRARENFFQLGNLTALRELTLRRLARRVDDQMVGYMKSHAIDGPWPAAERVLICVGADPGASALIRAGRHLAEQLDAPWTAIHVESAGLPPAAEAALAEAMTLAERSGGRTERLFGPDPAALILDYARRNNMTQIVVGQPGRHRWRPLARRLLAARSGIALHVVGAEAGEPGPLTRATAALRRIRPDPRGILLGTVSVALVAALPLSFPELRSLPNVSMLFLGAVLVSAVAYGRLAGFCTAVLSFLAYNFFFTEPYFTFRVSHWHQLIALFIFLLVASITGGLAGRVRDQVTSVRSRMAALQSLYDFSRRLGASKTADELMHAIVLQAFRLAKAPAIMLLPEDGGLRVVYAWPPEDRLDETAMAAARWTERHNEPAGAGTGTLPVCPWHFRPVTTGKTVVGVFGWQRRADDHRPDLLPTLDSLLDQGAVAIERLRFAAAAGQASADADTERFRNILLSSVSHDLRTPLTAILGSVTALRAGGALGPAAEDELLATIQEESERLDRTVANLLDMTRLEGGGLDIRQDWLSVPELFEAALARSRRHLGGLAVALDLSGDLPLLKADPTLMETVLVNLIDNAVRHAEGATRLTLSAAVAGGRIAITVADDGAGVPADQLPHLFDKFFRIRHQARAVAGSGLGLAIAKGMVEACGGRIGVQSPVAAGRGTRFTLDFPIHPMPDLPP